MIDGETNADRAEECARDEAIERLTRRIQQLESQLAAHGVPLPPPSATAAPRAAPHLAPAVAPGCAPAVAPPRAPAVAPPVVPPVVPSAAPPSVARSTAGRSGSAAERFVGTRIAAAVGALAVLAAAIYFIRYAIDAGLLGHLGPQAKFAAGVALALLLLLLGELARRRWSAEASIGLFASGTAALFATVGGAYFALDILSPEAAMVLVLATALLSAMIAHRSASLVVGSMGWIGGYSIPVFMRVLSIPGPIGGIYLTAMIAIVLGMVAAGPTRFALLRFLTLGATAALGALWFDAARIGSGTIALAVALWWGAFAASSLLDALRGRSARASAATLVLASAGASLTGLVALGASNAFTDPLAYMPLVIGLCLGALAFQLNDARQERRALEAPPPGPTASALQPLSPPEAPDAAARAVISALGRFAEAALATAPMAVLIGLCVFLPTGGVALGAALCASAMVRARPNVGAAVAVPSAIVALLICLAATIDALFFSTALRGGWILIGEVGPATDAIAQLLRIQLDLSQAAPTVAGLALLLPLSSRSTRGVLPGLCAAFGLVILLCVCTDAFGPWTGATVLALGAIALTLPGTRAQRWMAPALALALLSGAAWLVGMLLSQMKFSQFQVPLWLALLALLPPCAAMWSVTRLTSARAGRMLEAAALLVLALGTCLTLLLWMGQRPAADRQSFGVLLLALSGSALVLSVAARLHATRALLAVSLVPLLPAMLALSTAATLVLMGDPLPLELGLAGAWRLTLVAPLATLALALHLHRSALTEAGWIRPEMPVVAEVLWVGLLVTALSAIGTQPSQAWTPILTIGVLSAMGIGALAWGFLKRRASFRWVGLVLLAMLTLRVLLVDLREVATLLRVAILLATGLALVATSIAYARFMVPRRDQETPPAQ